MDNTTHEGQVDHRHYNEETCKIKLTREWRGYIVGRFQRMEQIPTQSGKDKLYGFDYENGLWPSEENDR